MKRVMGLLSGIGNVMLVTHGDLGLHARPMMVAEANNGLVTLLTDITSGKTWEIRQDSSVALTAQDKLSYVAVTGTASLGQDRSEIKRLWSKANEVWFEGPEDPRIGLIHVSLQTAEYWDERGTNLVRFALQAMKSAFVGERPAVDGNEHGTVGTR